jgi:hypothetical protein
MMRSIYTAAGKNMKTVYLNFPHSTRLEWIA